MRTLEERFWEKVEKTDSCWLWIGARKSDGYGHLVVDRRHKLAHRAAYELLVGPIPEGLDLDHLCRVPLCVNPAHLEPVTHGENMRRGLIWVRAIEAKRALTHCKHGHEFTPENTYINKRGGRVCRECGRICGRAYDLRRRGRVP